MTTIAGRNVQSSGFQGGRNVRCNAIVFRLQRLAAPKQQFPLDLTLGAVCPCQTADNSCVTTSSLAIILIGTFSAREIGHRALAPRIAR